MVFSFMEVSILQSIMIYNAVDHCKLTTCEVAEWVTVEDCDVSVLANFDGTDLIVDAEELSGADCNAFKSILFLKTVSHADTDVNREHSCCRLAVGCQHNIDVACCVEDARVFLLAAPDFHLHCACHERAKDNVSLDSLEFLDDLVAFCAVFD